MVFLPIKSLPNLLFWVLCLPGDQSHPVCATDNKPSSVLHLLDWFIGSRGFSSLERRSEFWVLPLNSFRSSQPGLHFLRVGEDLLQSENSTFLLNCLLFLLPYPTAYPWLMPICLKSVHFIIAYSKKPPLSP